MAIPATSSSDLQVATMAMSEGPRKTSVRSRESYQPVFLSILVFGDTELSLELWTIISGISGFDD